ncbi:hypothetical protein OEZ85_005057 [Tetradesmus obliquus]|uniref:Plastid lipid-associated protein/fibrillin conserved domain-containing protein n=1 Tax=Tetradesmus obliquus TaxID=3088 RepID=A0ABY8UH36_TETOB|nr:hypothetical protein OEZ85_005057 [Tetradesmus obliquus]
MQARLKSSVPAAGVSRSAVKPMALLSGLSGLFGGPKRAKAQDSAALRQQKKEELLELIEPLKRGLAATAEDQEAVEEVVQQLERLNPCTTPANICYTRCFVALHAVLPYVCAAAVVQQLERLNPTPKPLESPYLNGQWRLVYTTSDSILGRSKPAFLRPSGPIYQLLDGPNLRAANKETAPLYNQVYAELRPMSVNKVAVQFKTFRIFGLIPISAPASAKGELAMTYLDDEMRISRGDKGNLFVLLMDDPDARP